MAAVVARTAPVSKSILKLRGRVWARVGVVPIVPSAILLAFTVSALAADWISPHSPTIGSLSDRLLPPFSRASDSGIFLLGSDEQGRDILTRVIYGTRASLAVALVTVLIGEAIGTFVGLVSGYQGGWLDALLMRAVDAVMGLPLILFALSFAVTIGPGFTTVVLSLVLILWARYARVVRAEVLSLKEREFVLAARAVGCSGWRVMTHYLLPNVAATVLVLLSLQAGIVVIAEASLSFLGAGILPPTPAWGSMVAAGRATVVRAWWVSFFPGLAIVLFVLSFNLLGDWLREVLDPRLSQT